MASSIVGVTADAIEEDMDMQSPCPHAETRLTLMRGMLVMHCKDSFIEGGECMSALAFRLKQHATLLLTSVAKTDPEEDYTIGIKCSCCNEDLTTMEATYDLEVFFDKGKNALRMTCALCGTLVGLVPVASKEEIN